MRDPQDVMFTCREIIRQAQHLIFEASGPNYGVVNGVVPLPPPPPRESSGAPALPARRSSTEVFRGLTAEGTGLGATAPRRSDEEPQQPREEGHQLRRATAVLTPDVPPTASAVGTNTGLGATERTAGAAAAASTATQSVTQQPLPQPPSVQGRSSKEKPYLHLFGKLFISCLSRRLLLYRPFRRGLSVP